MKTIEVTEEVAAFLEQIKGRLNTQDNCYTRDPYFCVYQYRDIVTQEGYSTGDMDGGDRTVYTHDIYEGCIEEDEVDGFLKEQPHLSKDDLGELHISKIRTLASAHLTRESAEIWMAQNLHNLSSPFIYVESLFRCWEMIELRNFLMNVTII